jgi:hypothetical protein
LYAKGETVTAVAVFLILAPFAIVLDHHSRYRYILKVPPRQFLSRDGISSIALVIIGLGLQRKKQRQRGRIINR